MIWKRQKLTFMVIPDANKQVIRFQLSSIVLLSALVLFIVLALAATVAILLYNDSTDKIGKLEQQLTASTGQYEQIIAGKDKHIEDLQTEVAGLSDQARSIQDKIADVSKLESELKQLTGIESPDGGTAVAQMLEDADEYAMDGEGAGGEELPVTDWEIDELVLTTQENFTDLADTIDRMVPRLEETKDIVQRMQAKLRVTPTIWPTDSRKITSPFGVRKDPFTHRARFHAGIDISGSTGDPIYAAADGTVTGAGRDRSHGNNILVSHGNGIKTHYSHLSKMLVKPGATVKKGDIIGLMGSTGRSTGPHLHYEIYVNGEHVDPKPYLKADRKEN